MAIRSNQIKLPKISNSTNWMIYFNIKQNWILSNSNQIIKTKMMRSNMHSQFGSSSQVLLK